MNALDWLLQEFDLVTFRRFVNSNVGCTVCDDNPGHQAWSAYGHDAEGAARHCYEQIPWRPEAQNADAS
jgi:hypothetical protein